jgi:co-chaperonin GroES (HSP10)
MKQSKTLAAEESVDAGKMPELDTDADKYIRPKDGPGCQPGIDRFYEVEPIQCTGDYVAIAPLYRGEVTEGGIVVPGQADVLPDTGIIVGLGDNVGDILKVGQHVKFVPRHMAAELTGEIPFYGKATIAIYKAASVVAVLPQMRVLMKVESGPIDRNA